MRSLFVCGAGRSGTSAFASKIAREPSVFYLGTEQKIFSETDGLIDLYLNSTRFYTPNRQQEAFARVALLWRGAVHGWAIGGSPLNTPLLERLEKLFDDFLNKLPQRPWVGRDALLVQEAWESTQCLVVSAAGGDPEATRYWLDDTPHTLLNADTLRRLLPSCYFIEMLRDPRRVVASLVAVPWGPNDSVTALDWLSGYVVASRRARLLLPSGRVLRVRLEDVAQDPVAAAARVGSFLGVEVDRAVFADMDLRTSLARTPVEVDQLPPDARAQLAAIAQDWGYELADT